MSPLNEIESLKLRLIEMERQRDDWRRLHAREVQHRHDWEDRYKKATADLYAIREELYVIREGVQ